MQLSVESSTNKFGPLRTDTLKKLNNTSSAEKTSLQSRVSPLKYQEQNDVENSANLQLVAEQHTTPIYS